MVEGHSAEAVHSAQSSDDVVDEQTAVQVVYRPRSADTLVGLRVRGGSSGPGGCCEVCFSLCG